MTQQTLTRTRRVDWPRIIGNLQKVGMSTQEIADQAMVAKSTLFGYVAEDVPAEPPYWVGHRLLMLWCERCETRLVDVPLRQVEPSVSAMLKGMR